MSTELSYKFGGYALGAPASRAVPTRDGGLEIVGLASPFGVVDQQNDKVVPGAYRETLLARGATRPLLWSHDQGEPIGQVTALAEGEQGLFFKARISPTRRGLDAIALLKDGAAGGVSIGYATKDFAFEGTVRLLTGIDLYEISLVAMPAAIEARVLAIQDAGALADQLAIAEVETAKLLGVAPHAMQVKAALDARIRLLSSDQARDRQRMLGEISAGIRAAKRG
jgi:HK97 family phage prohead protease